MSDELRWGPLWGKCGHCNRIVRLEVDKAHHPHLNGKIGVRCTLCQKSSVYPFDATVEGELAAQAKAKAEAEKPRAAPPAHDPEEWPLFQCAMFGLLPQPSEPDEYTPDEQTLFRWRLLRAESVGLAGRVIPKEEHAND